MPGDGMRDGWGSQSESNPHYQLGNWTDHRPWRHWPADVV